MSHLPFLSIASSVVVMPGSQALTAVVGPQNTIFQLAPLTADPQAELTEFASGWSAVSGPVETSAKVNDPMSLLPKFCPNSCANPFLGMSSNVRSKWRTKLEFLAISSALIAFSSTAASLGVRVADLSTFKVEGHPAPEFTPPVVAGMGLG